MTKIDHSWTSGWFGSKPPETDADKETRKRWEETLDKLNQKIRKFRDEFCVAADKTTPRMRSLYRTREDRHNLSSDHQALVKDYDFLELQLHTLVKMRNELKARLEAKDYLK